MDNNTSTPDTRPPRPLAFMTRSSPKSPSPSYSYVVHCRSFPFWSPLVSSNAFTYRIGDQGIMKQYVQRGQGGCWSETKLWKIGLDPAAVLMTFTVLAVRWCSLPHPWAIASSPGQLWSGPPLRTRVEPTLRQQKIRKVAVSDRQRGKLILPT